MNGKRHVAHVRVRRGLLLALRAATLGVRLAAWVIARCGEFVAVETRPRPAPRGHAAQEGKVNGGGSSADVSRPPGRQWFGPCR